MSAARKVAGADTAVQADIAALAEALAWRLGLRTSAARPGAQPARGLGLGREIARLTPLWDHPDPRRIDLRRSLVDPFGTLRVRRFYQPAAITLWAVVDLSASLGARAAADRPGLAALLAAGLAAAAVQAGDRFGLVLARGGAGAEVTAPRRHAGLGPEVWAEVAGTPPHGRGSDALAGAAADIPADATLIVLISDFEWPAEVLDQVLAALGRHALWPIWLIDSGFETISPRFGLVDAIDLETGVRRLALHRPARARAHAATRTDRAARLDAVFARHARAPIRIVDQIDLAALTLALAGQA